MNATYDPQRDQQIQRDSNQEHDKPNIEQHRLLEQYPKHHQTDGPTSQYRANPSRDLQPFAILKK